MPSVKGVRPSPARHPACPLPQTPLSVSQAGWSLRVQDLCVRSLVHGLEGVCCDFRATKLASDTSCPCDKACNSTFLSLTSSTENRASPHLTGLFIYSFHKHLLSSFYVPGANLGAWRFSHEPN